ncbi:MAG: single-stranded DNA-binding protein, partial [Clostridia bacterium]
YNKSDYIPCIMWGRNARYVQNLAVGEKLCISGRIQSRTYVKTLGVEEAEERVAYEVSANKVVTESCMEAYINSCAKVDESESDNEYLSNDIV